MLVVSVWCISTSIELPVKLTVISWSLAPDCTVSISLELPEIVQALVQPITSHLTLMLLEAPVIAKS